MSLRWEAEDGDKVITLRNAKGSGNPVGRPYRLLVRRKDGTPLASAWLGTTHLATLMNQLRIELVPDKAFNRSDRRSYDHTRQDHPE